jgi:hypothetical protein
MFQTFWKKIHGHDVIYIRKVQQGRVYVYMNPVSVKNVDINITVDGTCTQIHICNVVIQCKSDQLLQQTYDYSELMVIHITTLVHVPLKPQQYSMTHVPCSC